MRPILLKGHTRPLTQVMFNRDGDLLFTSSKDSTVCVWYSDNGERLGTYEGHEGAIWDIDVNFDTKLLLTAASDRMAKVWDVQTGKEIGSMMHKAVVRTVAFSTGDEMCLTAQDTSFSSIPTIFVWKLDKDGKPVSSTDPITSLVSADTGKINSALWGHMNHTIIAGADDGSITIWDVETGKELDVIVEGDHPKAIRSLQYSKDRTMFIAASSDRHARIYDARSFELIKEFASNRPLNSAAISPVMNHVIVGGGQDAMDVTTTSTKVGHFEVDFHHLVYEHRMGSVKGHFGPVHSVAFSPDGKSFASGSEDGYIRLHHFDKSYFNTKNF